MLIFENTVKEKAECLTENDRLNFRFVDVDIEKLFEDVLISEMAKEQRKEGKSDNLAVNFLPKPLFVLRHC